MKLGMAKSGGRIFLATDVEGSIVDLSESAANADLLTVIRDWKMWQPQLQAAIDVGGSKVTDGVWQAPLPKPPKLLLLAGNFRAHVVESGFAPVPEGTTTPQFFMKPSTTIIGPVDDIPLTQANVALDYESELAVIIGSKVKDATPKNAMAAVWGYTIVNDVSERKLNGGMQDRRKRSTDDFYDWLVGKWFDGSAPMGPFAVTANELADDPSVIARLNGAVVQDTPIFQMIHSVAEAIVYISQVLTLEPGDVICMGTPSGVGMATGRLLQDGDVIECEVSGIGSLRNRVVKS
jgi:2-keto-4-pentenoate hydratase/2-oxohepta-3-ene-1,7-dioic acid hydratase in catechol pathway